MTAGSYDVQDDCFVELELKLASGNETVATHFRTILVEKGRKVVGIQTDSRVSGCTPPGSQVNAASPKQVSL